MLWLDMRGFCALENRMACEALLGPISLEELIQATRLEVV